MIFLTPKTQNRHQSSHCHPSRIQSNNKHDTCSQNINKNNYSPLQSTSQSTHSSTHTCNFYAFKKIREDMISPKDNIVVKTIRKLGTHLNHLNQVATVSSQNSPRQSLNMENKYIFDESIIIQRRNLPLQGRQFMKNKQQHLYHLMKLYHTELDLLCIPKLGLICHFEVHLQSFGQLKPIIMQLQHEGILKLFAQGQLTNSKYIAIYEPYEVDFERYIRREQFFTYCQLVQIFKAIFKTIAFMNQHGYLFRIQIENIVICNCEVKIKPKKIEKSERQIIRSVGIIGLDIVRNFRSKNPIIDMTPLRKTQFIHLMHQLLSNSQLTLEDAYVRVSLL